MFRLLMAVFRLGQRTARCGDSMQIVPVCAGDLLIFHVPQNVYGLELFRKDAAAAMDGALKDIGARAVMLPDTLKLTYLLKSPQGDADTKKG